MGLVCPRGVRPRVCHLECLRTSCQAHPDAVCVADPCNDCRVTFYRWVLAQGTAAVDTFDALLLLTDVTLLQS